MTYHIEFPGEGNRELEAEEIRAEYLAGKIQRRFLAWREGLPDWVKLQDLAAELDLPAAIPPPLPAQRPSPSTSAPAQECDVARAEISNCIFLRAAFFSVIGIGLLFAKEDGVRAIGVCILIFLALPILIADGLRKSSTQMVLTTHRLRMRTGILLKRSNEMVLGKIESTNVEQGILGQLFNYGTIVVRGTGSGAVPMPYISAPVHFREVIQAQLDQRP